MRSFISKPTVSWVPYYHLCKQGTQNCPTLAVIFYKLKTAINNVQSNCFTGLLTRNHRLITIIKDLTLLHLTSGYTKINRPNCCA